MLLCGFVIDEIAFWVLFLVTCCGSSFCCFCLFVALRECLLFCLFVMVVIVGVDDLFVYLLCLFCLISCCLCLVNSVAFFTFWFVFSLCCYLFGVLFVLF